MYAHEVDACAIDQWYNEFSKVTFESKILPLPKQVLDYLRSDAGIILPIECDQDNTESTKSEEWEEETSNLPDVANSEIEDQTLQRPSFPDFALLVRRVIADLGGAVIPKLNWSAPRDASWIGLANSLKCTTLSEIFLLLKSSEFIIHDLTQPYKDCANQPIPCKKDSSYVLVLRRWSDKINPGSEFRCFVKNHQLIAVSQRDNTQHYPYIKKDKESIKRDIKTFFIEHVYSKLISSHQESDNCDLKLKSLANFVFDIVRKQKDLVYLVDFNPFGPTTDSLLFEWTELMSEPEVGSDGSNYKFEFRFVEDDAGIQPNGKRHYSIPTDFVDLATGGDPHKLIDFLQLQQQIQSKDDNAE